MEKKSVQGKAESPHWRREATLRDILDLLDDIEKLDKLPEEKAKLRQRVIDYGQHLSEEIYHGKRKVPESDDNETIKQFNIRMYSTYDTKSGSSYEEAKRPSGYYDKDGKFIRDPYNRPRKGRVCHVNPRWHPIPLKEELPPPPPPIVVIDDGEGRNPPIIPPYGPTQTGSEGGNPPIVPPYGPTQAGSSNTTSSQTGSANSEEAGNEASQSDKDKKRRPSALWLIPIILGSAAALKDCESSDGGTPVNPDKGTNKTEDVKPTQSFTPAEKEFLRYTIEKGQRMAAKQFNVSVDEGAEIYNQFVENIRKGKLPDGMKDLTVSNNMTKMIDQDLGLNLDCPEIAATSWLVMSTSYEAITPIVHKGMTKPEEKLSSKEKIKLNKFLSYAQMAAESHKADKNSNHVVTVDYGLYGATKKTGWAVSFRKAQSDKKMYDGVVQKALHEGKGY